MLLLFVNRSLDFSCFTIVPGETRPEPLLCSLYAARFRPQMGFTVGTKARYQIRFFLLWSLDPSNHLPRKRPMNTHQQETPLPGEGFGGADERPILIWRCRFRTTAFPPVLIPGP